MGGDLTPALLAAPVWTDAMVAAAGIPIRDVELVTVGGGIGSFVLVDQLRIAGLPASAIRVLSTIDQPWQTYQYLTRVSQIPEHERIRSDSASTPDNIWGFPSYAVREAFTASTLRGFTRPLWQVLTEPVLSDYYTPRVGTVFASMAREAARIDWPSMLVRGQVRMVRRRAGGGYLTILTPPADGSESMPTLRLGSAPRRTAAPAELAPATRRIAYRSRFVHLAVGYPGLRFLPDLQEYRARHGDVRRVVNAYEPHEHVYDELVRHPATVVVRGAGIVASRILNRLINDRDRQGARTHIVHLFRTYVRGAHGPSVFMRRRGGDGWAYQGFNYPKSVWGGQLKARMRELEGAERRALYDAIGGTNTPRRRVWQEQLARGRREGWYTTHVGEVHTLEPGPDGTVVTRMRTADGMLEVPAAYVIDATGLIADIREHRVLADLLDHSGAGHNPLGRLDVERTFEVRGTRSDPGRLYASGAATLGGYFPGVDTFLGLQIAAQEIADDLASVGFGQRLDSRRSVTQWVRWMRNQPV
ncbi:conserved hypothetical protein [Frankia canadensis]|uniref:FHA domain-containing protein n=1 Tax=Frankia canadensis TaxID=1836972 RepID=A0A2I2KLC3_9ACTN|nr:hypothetical protein [Frankia canadensis]SNQ46471.1 conserved hypothetical protein [Frankia canadensis]SOU53761.1 conserved hypothetical protein [Frankia canadensis]